LFSLENRAAYQIKCKTTVERGSPQMTILRMCIACWVPKATNTHKVCNTHSFPTATMVALTRLSFTCIRALPVLFFLFGNAYPAPYRNINDVCTRGRNDDCGKRGWDTGGVTAELASAVAKHRNTNISCTQTRGTPADRKTDDLHLFHEFEAATV